MSPSRPPPQATLDQWVLAEEELERLTPAEREAYRKVRLDQSHGPRDLARATDRSPGTISNLLRRAEEKLAGGR